MQLYVLGPAFDLPSIDAECNASIALLKSQLSESTQWTIVSSHNISHRLPYIIDGDARIYGFNNIARHISAHHPRRGGSTYFSRSQRATSTALISLLETQAQILLDISLYISFENYYNTTRPAFTKILPWHANYIVPPALREKARRRTEHLGLGSVDVEDVHDGDVTDSRGSSSGLTDGIGKERKFEDEARKRASLLLPRRETVGRLLMQRQGGGAVFKIHALAGNLFDVLDEVLGEQRFFQGTEGIEVVDCAVWGYLSLMLCAPMPQDWVRRLLKGKYPRLVKWVERVREEAGLPVDVDGVMALARCASVEEVMKTREKKGMSLPWEPPAGAGIGDVVGMIGRDVLARIPYLGFADPTIISSSPSQHAFWRRYFPTIALTFATTIGAFGYYAFTTGLLVWPRGQEVHIFGRKQFSDYGHLGAALAGVSLLGRQATQAREASDEAVDVSPVRVEVGVEGS